MLNLTRRYAELKDSLRNVNKNIAERIIEILESSGSEILRAEHLISGGQKVTLDTILIMSDQMRRSIKAFTDNIRNIGTNEKLTTGSQFYITDYGGSKTQFIELIKNHIKEFKTRDEPPFNRIIVVTFNGCIDLTPSYLGAKIEHDTATLLTRQLEILQRDPNEKVDSNAFDNFMNYLLEFRKLKDAPEHLDEIYKILMDLERISEKSAGITMNIARIRHELSQLPVIDEERLIKTVLDIMIYASKFHIIYLFLFDECDDWLTKTEEESKWDLNFLKRQYFFRKLYDNIPNLRLYQIYFFTPRIYEALRSEKSDMAPGIQRISSDIAKISSSGPYIQVREQGVYQGDEAVEAVLKWLIILERALQPADKEIFNSFLPILIEKIDNRLSRRKANSTIISSIKAFIQLTDDIKNGQNQYSLAERNPSQYITIGNIIEKTFPSYLNFLNFNFMKKHVEVGGNKKIDGRFMGSKSSEIEFYAEIKSFKEPSMFKLEKIEQVTNCISNLKSKAVLFLFCPGLTEGYVREELYKWKNLGLIAPEIRIEDIMLIVISDQTLLNSLVGFESIAPSRLNEKLENFDALLRLINKDFHGKLINLFPAEEKIGEEKVEAPPAEEKMPEPSVEEEIPRLVETPPFKSAPIGEPQKPMEIASPVPSTPTKGSVITPVEESYDQLWKKLKNITDTTIRTAVEVVKALGTVKKVYTQRKIDTVKEEVSPLLKNSFNDAVEFLIRHRIIQELKDKLNFNWDRFDKLDIKNDPEGLMVQIFKAILNVLPGKG